MTWTYLSINTLVSKRENEKTIDAIILLSAPIATILRFQEIIDKFVFFVGVQKKS